MNLIDKLKHKIAAFLEKIGKFLLRSYDQRIDLLVDRVEQQSRELISLRYMLNTMVAQDTLKPRGDHPEIVVCLTSFPARITSVSNVIENMLAQTVMPDRIVLYLSELNFPHKEEDLPLRLLKLQSQGVEIRWLKDDMRSYKKIIPALQDFSQDLVITVDDDLVYPSYLIEKLVDAHKLHPNAICAARTHRIKLKEDGSIKPYEEWHKSCCGFILQPRYDLFATTGAGTLFPPGVFSDAVFDKETILELCPDADDVWVKCMAMKENVPVVLSMWVEKLRYVPGTQTQSLWATNIHNNDLQLAAVTKRFGDQIWDKLEDKQ